MNYRKNYNIYISGIIIFTVITLIGLVYAAFTGQLNIRGQGVNRHSKWDIHFENLSSITTSGTAKVLNNAEPQIDENDPTSIEDYNVSLTSPGDSISFTFDAVNDGNYNAKITSVNIDTPECTGTDSTSNTNVCNHIHYYLNYDSGAQVQVNDVLYAKEVNKMKVTLVYDDTVTSSELAVADVSISNLSITINFEQQGDALVKNNGEVADDYKAYKQGYKFSLNNDDYYVIENSGADKDYVVALKEESLTCEELNTYKEGTAINIASRDGFGGMRFGETSDYDSSEIKTIVDKWQLDKFQNNELKTVNNYNARLITTDEWNAISSSWKNYPYIYWTMTLSSNSQVCEVMHNYIYSDAVTNNGLVHASISTVRPVVNVYKSAIQ